MCFTSSLFCILVVASKIMTNQGKRIFRFMNSCLKKKKSSKFSYDLSMLIK